MAEDRNLITVILDTNVFVAAYWARSSASARLLRACLDGRVQAQYSPEVKREVMRTLRTIKVHQSYLRSIDAFWDSAIQIEAAAVTSVSAADPDDQKFLEAAAGGGTDYLATNDDHLLSVGYVGRTEILTPGSLARVLGI
jgi:putative PIN family toxin of toxin-antitoxin system